MNNFISGNEIAKLCDHIFSQTIPDYNSNLGYKVVVNYDVFEKIKSRQSVFVKTDFLFEFFEIIKQKSNVSNIKLVTHDSDKIIDHLVVEKIPSCIDKIFSINSCCISDKIIPIPIGIANDYCKITVKPKFKEDFCAKGIKALIACNVQNNFKERSLLYSHKFDDNVNVINNLANITDYEILLKEHDFIFCPEGNGPDTHRIWETLYLGKIPIVKKAVWNRNFKNLPIMFVDSLLDVSEKSREQFLCSLLDKDIFDLSMLDLTYWKKAINEIE